MRVLFIGGNGNISWWCVEEALKKGYEVYELNRKLTRRTRREVQTGVKEIIADIKDKEAVIKGLSNLQFDVVCDFICFNSEQARQAISLFSDRTRQYIAISSEAVYKRESRFLPFKENTPLYDENTIADSYIAGKIKVEKTFREAYEKNGFPMTIVRPGYTYDTIIQMPVGQNCFTAPQKLMEGYPFLMPGDGENLVAPMHSRDFAGAFVELIGNDKAIGENYHIAAKRLITWNEMADSVLSALGIKNKKIFHIPYEDALYITDFYSEVVNRQHMWHYIFDDSKIKSLAPQWEQKTDFRDGIKETVSWLMEDKVRQRINLDYEAKLMAIYSRYRQGRS